MSEKPKMKIEDILFKTNNLLIAIVVLLATILVCQIVIGSNIVNISDYVHGGFGAVYERMGRMRVF